MIKVINLSTLEEHIYSHDNPRDAVITSYAFSKNDKHWWGFLSNGTYNHLLVEGEKTIACGDWCALKA